MKYVISNYKNDLRWLDEYGITDYVIYDQSGECELPNTIKREHGGADLLDKFHYIVNNYDNLPDVIALIKGNLFKFISKEEFDMVKDNIIFTPLLTQNHKTYLPICWYENGLYWEINNSWYASQFPSKFFSNYNDFAKEMGLPTPTYLPFAPGSNYLVPKENIHMRSKAFYEKLIGYIDYTTYSAEVQMIERSLYNIWKT